jgi:hypothetical protein
MKRFQRDCRPGRRTPLTVEAGRAAGFVSLEAPAMGAILNSAVRTHLEKRRIRA